MSNIVTHHSIASEIDNLQWPEDWRIWTYVTNQALSKQQMTEVRHKFHEFKKQWSAHGKLLKSEIALLDRQIVVIAVDENHAKTTGCSLDKLTYFVGQLDKSLQTDFLDRSKVYYYDALLGQWKAMTRKDFKAAYQNNSLHDETLVLDSLVNQVSGMGALTVKLKDSWHAKIV